MFDNITPAGENVLKAQGAKGVISFAGNPKEVIFKVGISPVSSENALSNINSQAPGWDFNKIVKQAEAKWNHELSKIEIETTDPTLKEIFCNVMYHSFISHVWFTD